MGGGGRLTTRATPPLEISVAQASISTHGELFNSPRNQKDRTALDAEVESREQPIIPPTRLPRALASCCGVFYNVRTYVHIRIRIPAYLVGTWYDREGLLER